MAAGDHEENRPIVVLQGGASLVKISPVFSPDSKYLLCASGIDIKVLSVVSGECTLELHGHKQPITSIIINPDNQFQLLSSSLDLSIIKWDYIDGIILKKYQLEYPITTLLSLHQEELLATQYVRKAYKLVRINLPKQNEDPAKCNVLCHYLPQEQKCVAIGNQSEYAAWIWDNSLSVYWFKQEKRKELKYEDGKLTCVACHPTEANIATGCKDGKIVLWWNFFRTKEVVRTVIHWHALPVGDLSFTTEGSYLLSGGHECVLVKWQHGTQHKTTLPRLGAPIARVITSPDNTCYATCHSDNVVQVITSNLRVSQVVTGLTKKYAINRPTNSPVSLLLDPRTKAVVTNGRPGHLQFYNIYNDKQLYQLDIVCQNYISPENLQRPLAYTEVEKVAFSADGKWLATVEARDDEHTAVEMRLKFWEYSRKDQTYVLNTDVDLPHSEPITSLSFRPSTNDEDQGPMVVSTSKDGKFKLWQLVDDTDIYRDNVRWSCESVGFYREQPASFADFSDDGTLLAVAFGTTLTLWDPDTNALRTTLTHGTITKNIKHVLFGRGTCSHLLVCTTGSHLLVWNLLTCSVQWLWTKKVSTLTRCSISEHFAAFTDDRELLVFTLCNSTPVYTHSNVSSSRVTAALFVPGNQSGKMSGTCLYWQNRAQLFFLTDQQQLLTIKLEADVVHAHSSNTQEMVMNLQPTPFSALLAEQRNRVNEVADRDRMDKQHGRPGSEYLQEMLKTPAHVLPPVSSVAMSFMDQLLIHTTNSRTHGSPGEIDESDSEDDMRENGVSADSSSDEMDIGHSPETLTKVHAKKIPDKDTGQIIFGLENLSPSSLEWTHSLSL